MITPRQFVLGGNAIFTVTGKTKSFTFRAKKPKKPKGGPVVFVSVLTGPNNIRDYTTLGTIFDNVHYVHNKKRSPIGADADSAKAFDWLWNHIDNLPACCQFRHEGRCACCGRTLTTPESIDRGIGPECASKSGL